MRANWSNDGASILKAVMKRGLIGPFVSIHAVEGSMSRIWLGTICGLVYGAFSAASMIPLSFSDKTAALTGAFINRFAIGFVIGAARLPLPAWAQGLVFGILLSLPDAIITKAFAPILILGALGGLIISVIVGKWGVGARGQL